mgnify:CR=1 FL=1
MPTVAFSPRFYRDVTGTKFRDLHGAISFEVRRLQKHGMIVKGKAKETEGQPLAVKSLRHREHLFSRRLHDGRRLVIKKLSEDLIKLVCLLPRGEKIYDEQRRNWELDALAEKELPSGKTMEIEQVLGLRKPKNEREAVPSPVPQEIPTTSVASHDEEEDAPVAVEPASVEELLHVYASTDLLRRFAELEKWPDEQLEMLTACQDVDEVLALDMDSDKLEVLLGFLVESQASSDIERCYELPDDEFGVVAARPLQSFLLHIDDEQKRAIERSLESGPFLVNGAAGTGKSIVCLYRMRRMIEERTGESLFDGAHRPAYRFISYTRQLVGSAKELFHQIGRGLPLNQIDLQFQTADQLITNIAQWLEKSGKIDFPKKADQQSKLYKTIRNYCIEDRIGNKAFERISHRFLEIEIEEVIIDQGISNLDDYLKTKRRGRKSPLQGNDRRAIWAAYEKMVRLCEKKNITTWAGWRRAVLDQLRKRAGEIPSLACLVVDEAQDLSRTQLAILKEVAGDPKIVTLASDLGQSIYRRTRVGSDAKEGFKIEKRRVVTLNRCHRMTREIQAALEPIRRRAASGATTGGLPESVFSGPIPQIHQCSANGHATVVAEIIKQKVGQFGTNYGQFAILVESVSVSGSRAKLLQKVFLQRDIPCKVHDRTNPVVADLNEVHILTAASSKGLEFPHVIIPWADQIGFSEDELEAGKTESIEERFRLFYVACSRAAESLALVHGDDICGSVCECLDDNDWHRIRHEGKQEPVAVTEDDDVPF